MSFDNAEWENYKSNLRNELYNKEKSNNKPYGLELLILSYGNLTKNFIRDMPSLSSYFVDSAPPIPLRRVTLLCSNPPKNLFELKSGLGAFRVNISSQSYLSGSKRVNEPVRDYSMIKSYFNHDVIFITSGRDPAGETDRNKLIDSNNPIIHNIAQYVKGYKGLVVLTTNPVDTLSQILMTEAGLLPEQVIGLQPEGFRLREIVADKLSFNLNKLRMFTSGIHGKDNFILESSLAEIEDTGPVITHYTTGKVKEILKNAKAWPVLLRENGESADNSAAEALIEYLSAILTPGYDGKSSDKVICASSHFSLDEILNIIDKDVVSEEETSSLEKALPNKGLYIGWPLRFFAVRNGSRKAGVSEPKILIRTRKLEPDEISLDETNKLSRKDIKNFYTSVKEQIESLNLADSLIKGENYMKRGTAVSPAKRPNLEILNEVISKQQLPKETYNLHRIGIAFPRYASIFEVNTESPDYSRIIMQVNLPARTVVSNEGDIYIGSAHKIIMIKDFLNSFSMSDISQKYFKLPVLSNDNHLNGSGRAKGFNSIAVYKTKRFLQRDIKELFASHSDFGLLSWNMSNNKNTVYNLETMVNEGSVNKVNPGDLLSYFESLRHTRTRGAALIGENSQDLIFSHNNYIIILNPASERVKYIKEMPERILSLKAVNNTAFFIEEGCPSDGNCSYLYSVRDDGNYLVKKLSEVQIERINPSLKGLKFRSFYPYFDGIEYHIALTFRRPDSRSNQGQYETALNTFLLVDLDKELNPKEIKPFEVPDVYRVRRVLILDKDNLLLEEKIGRSSVDHNLSLYNTKTGERKAIFSWFSNILDITPF